MIKMTVGLCITLGSFKGCYSIASSDVIEETSRNGYNIEEMKMKSGRDKNSDE